MFYMSMRKTSGEVLVGVYGPMSVITTRDNGMYNPVPSFPRGSSLFYYSKLSQSFEYDEKISCKVVRSRNLHITLTCSQTFIFPC